MNILSLPMGADTGGVSRAIGAAFDGVAGWSFRSIISTLNYIDYAPDMRWSKETVEQYWRWADVVHCHHNLIAPERLTKGWKGFRLPKRRYVVHFHGTGFREEPKRHLTEMRKWRATGVVATLDLWLQAPELEWLPCPINVEAMRAWKASPQLAQVPRTAQEGHEQDDGRQDRQLPQKEEAVIRIAHAPTNREIKSTATVIEAVDALKAEGYPVELDLIEGVTWAECLSRKATADIYVDQVKLGYGNNAIECWGMGIPVIAGGAEATLEEMERRFGSLPFYNATEATMLDALRTLVEDPGQRDAWAQRGLRHVQEFHDERVVVEQLKELYQRAAGIKEQVA